MFLKNKKEKVCVHILDFYSWQNNRNVVCVLLSSLLNNLQLCREGYLSALYPLRQYSRYSRRNRIPFSIYGQYSVAAVFCIHTRSFSERFHCCTVWKLLYEVPVYKTVPEKYK